MNTDVKYIYPITRVRSIERLLRVTAHNAFFVMSPLNIKSMYEQDIGRGWDVVETAMLPKLYQRRSIIYSHKSRSLKHKRQSRTVPSGDINSDPTHTPLIATTPVNYQSAMESGDPSNNGFILHGVILRHQLVELLRNRVFFEESQGVRRGGGRER